MCFVAATIHLPHLIGRSFLHLKRISHWLSVIPDAGRTLVAIGLLFCATSAYAQSPQQLADPKQDTLLHTTKKTVDTTLTHTVLPANGYFRRPAVQRAGSA